MIWAIVASLFVVLIAGFMIYSLQQQVVAAQQQSIGGLINKGLAAAGL